MWGLRVRAGLCLPIVALPLLGAAPGRAEDQVAAVRVRVGEVDANMAVNRAILGASRRLARPACQALLGEFKDISGRTLKANLDDLGLSAEAHLGKLLFYDGDALRPCRDRQTLAATSPHNSVVFVCTAAFKSAIERDHRLVEYIVIHETMHTLGLGENPPTSREITDRVDQACR